MCIYRGASCIYIGGDPVYTAAAVKEPTKLRSVRLTDEEMAWAKERGGVARVVRDAMAGSVSEIPEPIAEAKAMVEKLEETAAIQANPPMMSLTGTGKKAMPEVVNHTHRWKPDAGASWMEVCMDCSERRVK